MQNRKRDTDAQYAFDVEVGKWKEAESSPTWSVYGESGIYFSLSNAWFKEL